MIIRDILRVARMLMSADIGNIDFIAQTGVSHEARFEPNSKIGISAKFFKHSKKGQFHILLHELGHWFRWHNVELSDIMGWEDEENFNNLWGAGNSDEGFAESFAVYCQTPSEFKQRYPEQYERMVGYVGSTSKYVSWAKQKLKEIHSDYQFEELKG
jgi:hypothetical protein